MECPELVFSLFLMGNSAVWGVFGGFLGGLLYFFYDFLMALMFCVVFFKFFNAVGLAVYLGLCEQVSIYWGILALCTYPLYHSFLLTVFVLISKGYLIVFPKLPERDNLLIASILSSSYLVYSVSLINSSMLSLLILLYLGVFSSIILRNCNQLIWVLWERSEAVQTEDSEVIKARISKYQSFLKLFLGYLLCEFTAGATGFIFWALRFRYEFPVFMVYQCCIEVYRLIVFLSVFYLFNPSSHLDPEFQRVFTHTVQRIRLIRGGVRNRWYGVVYLPFEDQIMLGRALK